MAKFFVWIAVIYCAPLYSNDFTIRGKVTNSIGEPVQVVVSAAKPGTPYIDNATNEPWQLLQNTISDENGNYSLTFDDAGLEKVFVSIEYYANYYLQKEITLSNSDSPVTLDFSKPVVDEGDVSFILRIFKSGVEINYNSVVLIVIILRLGDTPNGRMLNLSTIDIIKDKKQIFGLPPGSYRAFVAYVTETTAGSVINKSVDFGLPLPALPESTPGEPKYLDIVLD